MKKTPKTLAEKLNPNRFTEMSGKMASLVAYVLGVEWTNPSHSPGSIVVTSDGHMLAQHGNEYFDKLSEFERNLRTLFAVAGLTAKQMAEFRGQFRKAFGLAADRELSF